MVSCLVNSGFVHFQNMLSYNHAFLSFSSIPNTMDDQEPCSFNLRLIEAVRSSRCLYDSKDRLYRSAEHKIKVWNRLVQHLQFDGLFESIHLIITAVYSA